jgi:hypothetical protein
MSLKNKMIVEKFVSAFIKRNYELYINYLADDIKWNIVGMPSINGKQNFLDAMELMEIWPEGGETIIAEGEYVVIENQNYSPNNNPAHCDIYRIYKGKIKEVTTYIVDTTAND